MLIVRQRDIEICGVGLLQGGREGGVSAFHSRCIRRFSCSVCERVGIGGSLNSCIKLLLGGKVGSVVLATCGIRLSLESERDGCCGAAVGRIRSICSSSESRVQPSGRRIEYLLSRRCGILIRSSDAGESRIVRGLLAVNDCLPRRVGLRNDALIAAQKRGRIRVKRGEGAA